MHSPGFVTRSGSRSRSGQSTVEYMMVISVISLGLFFVAMEFVPGFKDGLSAMQDDVEDYVDAGVVGGGTP